MEDHFWKDLTGDYRIPIILVSTSRAPKVLVPSSSQAVNEQSEQSEEEPDGRDRTHRPRTRHDMIMEYPVDSTMPSIADPPRWQPPAARPITPRGTKNVKEGPEKANGANSSKASLKGMKIKELRDS